MGYAFNCQETFDFVDSLLIFELEAFCHCVHQAIAHSLRWADQFDDLRDKSVNHGHHVQNVASCDQIPLRSLLFDDRREEGDVNGSDVKAYSFVIDFLEPFQIAFPGVRESGALL